MTTDSQHWITVEDRAAVQDLLNKCGALHFGESVIRLSPAGEGNMNVTLRVESERRSWIVKQSRPFVAKYPQIEAPVDRICHEAAFYEHIQRNAVIRGAMPQLIAWLPDSHVLLLEDLGVAADATSVYRCLSEEGPLPQILPPLIEWLTELHSWSRGISDATTFENRALRMLNHSHIFDIPFRSPAVVDLDSILPGLATVAQVVCSDTTLKARIQELGQIYLASDQSLLHGDFYPGSWLVTPNGPKVIDPEFCFVGATEFDWGVLLAHVRLVAGSQVEQKQVLEASRRASQQLDLVNSFAAVEILRRLLGVAQLPLETDLGTRTSQVHQALSILN